MTPLTRVIESQQGSWQDVNVHLRVERRLRNVGQVGLLLQEGLLIVAPQRLADKSSDSRASSATMTQVWLDRSLVGHVPGCLAGLRRVATLSWVSVGFSSLLQKRRMTVLKPLQTLGQPQEQAATSE